MPTRTRPGRITVTAALTAVAALATVSCTDTAAEDTTATPTGSMCEEIPAADVTTAQGWIGYLNENPEDVAVLVHDGTGVVVDHESERAQPLASAVKVVHLAAYARAVEDGRLDPDEQIPLAEWERWYLPGTDGGAHPAALERLGVAGPDATIRLDDMVSAMIRESDNAVPDYLRDRLGDDALHAAAAQGGWNGFAPPTMLGNTLALLDPSIDGSDAMWEAARRYADDPAYREEVLTSTFAEETLFDDVDRIQSADNAASAADLTRLHRSIADLTFGPGAEVAREHLEWQPAPPDAGFTATGFKGGSLPGVLTDAITFRLDDGTVASAVILVSDMSADDYTAALDSFAHQQLLFAAALDPEVPEQIRCAT